MRMDVCEAGPVCAHPKKPEQAKEANSPVIVVGFRSNAIKCTQAVSEHLMREFGSYLKDVNKRVGKPKTLRWEECVLANGVEVEAGRKVDCDDEKESKFRFIVGFKANVGFLDTAQLLDLEKSLGSYIRTVMHVMQQGPTLFGLPCEWEGVISNCA